MKREFYLQDDQSNKFWTIEAIGTSVVTTNGRMGAKPRETRTNYESSEQAARALEKEVLAKRRKGYLEGNLAALPEYKPRLPPRFVQINHDDYHAQYVGKTADKHQFFLTFPFAPTVGTAKGGSYIALYLFDEFGLLTDAQIFDQHLEKLSTQTAVEQFTEVLLSKLGTYELGNIKVAPFSIEKFGRTFGLVYDAGEHDEDEEDLGVWVTVEPGNYMAFSPPWDGDYDT